jgi:hypothetical protein
MLRLIVIFVLAAALPLAAHMGPGPKGPHTPAPRVHPPAPLEAAVITGAVAMVNLAYGVQYPSIEVGGKTIQLAPAYYLPENGFERDRHHEDRPRADPLRQRLRTEDG